MNPEDSSWWGTAGLPQLRLASGCSGGEPAAPTLGPRLSEAGRWYPAQTRVQGNRAAGGVAETTLEVGLLPSFLERGHREEQGHPDF